MLHLNIKYVSRFQSLLYHVLHHIEHKASSNQVSISKVVVSKYSKYK